MAGEKLTMDNPNVADLSDMNRPTKLGELYSELYDNEWTDAYVSLTKSDYDEKEAIDILRETLFVRTIENITSISISKNAVNHR